MYTLFNIYYLSLSVSELCTDDEIRQAYLSSSRPTQFFTVGTRSMAFYVRSHVQYITVLLPYLVLISRRWCARKMDIIRTSDVYICTLH